MLVAEEVGVVGESGAGDEGVGGGGGGGGLREATVLASEADEVMLYPAGKAVVSTTYSATRKSFPLLDLRASPPESMTVALEARLRDELAEGLCRRVRRDLLRSGIDDEGERS